MGRRAVGEPACLRRYLEAGCDPWPNAGNYGFGWEIASYHGREVWRHSGSTSGFRTHIARFPNERLTVIVLLNRADLDAQALALAVADRFLTVAAR